MPHLTTNPQEFCPNDEVCVECEKPLDLDTPDLDAYELAFDGFCSQACKDVSEPPSCTNCGLIGYCNC